MRSLRVRRALPSAVGHVALAALGVIYMYPFLWMIASSFKTRGEFFTNGLSLMPQSLKWTNYLEAWTAAKFATYFGNTVLVAVVTTVLVVILTSMAGYALTRSNFPGRMALLGAMLSTMFLPRGYTIIPIFEIIRALNLLNTLWAIILVNTATSMVFNTFLFVGYFTTIPREIEDSARIEGAGFPTLYWRIAIPLAMPMVASVFLLEFIENWNSFFVPLVFTFARPELRTLAVGIYSLVAENSTQWTLLCAAATMSILPTVLLFIFLQRTFVNGVAGAIRG